MQHTLTLLTGVLLAPLAALQAADQPLESGFVNPSLQSRPMVWWHWMDGNVTREGVTLDLESMQRVGLGGASIFTLGPIVASPSTGLAKVEYQSPEWMELVGHAGREAQRLGLDLGTMVCAGWATAGGTWVKPEQAMRKLVWSETSLAGPGRFAGPLPQPPDCYGPFQDLIAHGTEGRRHYEDSAVVAYRQPEGAQRMADAGPAVSCSATGLDMRTVWDGRLATRVELPKGPGTAWVRYDFAQPFACRGVVSWAALPQGSRAELEASDDGQTFRSVGRVLQWASPTLVADNGLPLYSWTRPTTARCFRVSFTGLTQRLVVGELQLAGEFWLGSWPRSWTMNTFPLPLDARPAGIPATNVVDLTSHLKSDGTLDWEFPSGRWVILRFGHTPTGHMNNRPPPAAAGLECDKLSREAVRAFLDGVFSPLERRFGSPGKAGLRHLLMDSWECDGQSWTPAMIGEFARRRGYDPRPWMPVFTGRVVGSAMLSERFLCDFRLTIGDLLVENYYAAADEIARRKGLVLMAEAPGIVSTCIDALRAKGAVQVPMGEFWHRDVFDEKSNFRSLLDCRDASSGAHLYGKRVVAAEAFTYAGGWIWRSHPFTLKALGDLYFCQGVNRFVFHSYPHQPFADPRQRPGMSMWTIGTFFGRTDTWWETGGKAWVAYLTRCQHLLQQGRPVRDVAILVGETIPSGAIASSGIERTIRSLPPGYDYDLVNADALLTRISPRDGRAVLPDGNSYRVLAIPDAAVMSPAVAARVRDLVAGGVAVVGAKPAIAPTLTDYPVCDEQVRRIAEEVWGNCDGKSVTQRAYKAGWVFNGASVSAALERAGVAPDFTYRAAVTNAALVFTHRWLDDGAHVFFVSHQGTETLDRVECSFRVAGLQPELWDPADGSLHDASAFRIENGRTVVPLRFDPAGSRFVVFRRATSITNGPVTHNDPAYAAVMSLAGPWSVSFDPTLGGPASVEFQALEDWTSRPEPGIRFYSGTATYRAAFDLVAGQAARPLFLDLGGVGIMAEVTLNGRELGTLWKPPFRVALADAVRPGRNELTVRVTNPWANRLIGDNGLAETQRIARVSYPNPYKADAPLVSSGLRGPVTVQTVCGGETP